VTAAEEGKPEALGALQGASGEWQTAGNEANLVRQRCNMRKPFESNSRRGGEKPRGRRPSCSTWRWHDLVRAHRAVRSGSKGEVGGEALQEDESSREVRTDGHGAELTRRFHFGGGGAEATERSNRSEQRERANPYRELSLASCRTPRTWGLCSMMAVKGNRERRQKGQALRTIQQWSKVEREAGIQEPATNCRSDGTVW
jgi:hypothetical protein